MKNTFIAIGVQLIIMAFVILPGLAVYVEGANIALATVPIDEATYHGEYVELHYDVGDVVIPQEQAQQLKVGSPVYITVTEEVPAKFVQASLQLPKLQDGQACIKGRIREEDGKVEFPQVQFYYPTEEEILLIELARGDQIIASVKSTAMCNAAIESLHQAED